jgi:amino acid adenylation domain-containing protein
MVLLTAFKVLLMRYSGQCDIVVGTDITDRSYVETESMIGFCVNTLVSRTDLSGNPTFRELLAQVYAATLKDIAYRDMPFDLLVADLQPERHLSHSPLVQVMFDLQDTQVIDTPFAGLILERLFIDGNTAKFDLLFDLLDTKEGLSGSVEYRTGMFERETILRLLNYWQTLLENIVINPDLPIGVLPLLKETERQQMLVEWNNTATSYPTQSIFQILFEAQVVASPDRIAVVYQGQHLTYAQLDRLANQLAHYLCLSGVSPEVLVGIYLERSFEMLIAMLAIFKAGGAYVPLDLAYPRERLERVLAETQARLILTTKNWHAFLSDIHPSIVSLDSIWDELAAYNVQSPLVHYHHHNLAYVIYTSGSTGRPKGAMLTQAGMINHLYAKIDVLGLHQNERIAQTASLCFDISAWQFLSPLLCGASVCILGEEDTYNPSRLFCCLVNEDISTLELVPPHLRMVLDELESTDTQAPSWMKLRWMISTGEAISPVLCSRWLKRFPHSAVINTYGATECSDDVTHSSTQHILAEQTINVSVGRPIEGMQVYILDTQLELVPIGGIGQIYIGGVGVGRGYMHDAVSTAKTFIPDPYNKEPGCRFYQTGDLGRYLSDGQIECLGRSDHQVKVRGHRVELGEIEVVLGQHLTLRECVVIDWEKQPGDKQLVAYVVAKEGFAASTTVLRDYLHEKLPDYMVPAYFVWLEMLPLNSNGKIDRRALAVPDQVRSELDVAFVPPRSVAEEIIAEIWSSLLNRDQIGIYDNFFTIGGHSLLATQIIARIHNIFQIDVPLRLLFELPTVDSLTNGIAQLIGGRDLLEEIALIFKEVDNLTEDEVIRLSGENIH